MKSSGNISQTLVTRVFTECQQTHSISISTLQCQKHCKEEGLEIKQDSSAKYDFDKMDKSSFWIKFFKVYPRVSQAAIRLYLPFSSTYSCKNTFSTLVAIKTKFRNKLNVTYVVPLLKHNQE
ncbi:hypothetical protein WA026_011376 [Henosepilachna vigintioctopunctata]|uniref:HAT C-terminal dimerisation domain-containing protein n=1 Tax=Henosepilachna vigintioctopunctata TaxID=420089 RepID=A0AAW1TQZ6_9CUCU